MSAVPRRVRTPTVLQMEAVECGAACLGIVLGYHHRFVPLEELRVACGVSRDGSKASNVLKAARTFGLTATGYKKDLEGVRGLRPPFIVFWNFNHFVVVEGFGKQNVFLNDPAVGPRSVSNAEFDLAFTGVVLVLEKGPAFQRGGAPQRVLANLAQRLRNNRIALVYVLLVTLALALPNLIVPVFSRIYIDDFLIEGKRSWLTPLLMAMGAAIGVKCVLTFLQQHVLLKAETKLAVVSSAEFFAHVLKLPMDFFSQRYAGEVSNRVQLNDRVAALLAGELATGVANLLFIGLYAILMFQYDKVLTAIGVVAAALNLLALQQISRRRKDQNIRLLQERGKLTGVSMAALQLIETIKSTGAEPDYFSRWAGYQAKLVNAEQELGISTLALTSIPIFLSAVTGIAVLGLGGLRVIRGLLTVGALTAFQVLMTSFLDPVNRIVDLGGSLQEASGDLSRLDDVLRYPRVKRPAQSELLKGHKLEGQLELRDVSFGYSRLEPAQLKSFSLVLPPGKRVALVGASGSGKSTVAKLVAGLFEPWEGEILFDGLPRTRIDPDVLATSVALVDQDIFLFGGSIRQNITLWNESVEETFVLQAAEDAVIHDDVTIRPGGYESIVEEEGRNFSGGQRQRLEIARALAVEPKLLILDEATSALDTVTERQIDEHLRRRGCSCLIVAHRLSTIRDCDEILVLKSGVVAERGTHEQLMLLGGLYSELVRTI